jgi:prefoldin subunit 5
MTALGELTPTPSAPVRHRRRRRAPWVVGTLAALLAVAVLVALAPWDPYRIQWFQDQYVVLTHPSTDDIVAIADATGMSDEGKLIFLASTPAVENADAFNADCSVESEGTLGCFDGTDIYVFAVTDPRLQGTIEVTGAHEMLHAAYQRLTAGDRKNVDALVDQAVAALPKDDPVFAAMELYPTSQWPDEWHSRLGTEFADLPPALEAHYATYFDDRARVLDLEQKSTAQLDELQQQIDDLAAQVDDLDADVTKRSKAYDKALKNYNADVSAFNDRADSGGFSGQAEFDAARTALVARGDELEQKRKALNTQIDKYNKLVDQLTSLDADYADLYHSLDSTGAPDSGSIDG